jgi:hypothetical protein
MTTTLSATDLLAPTDPLLAAGAPERVNYATGVLLQADDFRDEQTYHRGRLAAALAHMLGHGTIAGLGVHAPASGDNDLHLTVDPGIAIDRFGRLIEVGQAWCTRLARWYAAQTTGDLLASLQRSPRTPFALAVVADVFLSLADCGRGKTPSLAQGPFDALDALVPARLAESPSFKLVLRFEGPPGPIPSPANHWPDPTASAEARLAAVLGSYRPGAGDGIDGGLAPFAEHVTGEDASAVLLARVMIPVALPAAAPANARPTLDLGQQVSVDNRLRPFISLPGKWLGAVPTLVPTHEP